MNTEQEVLPKAFTFVRQFLMGILFGIILLAAVVMILDFLFSLVLSFDLPALLWGAPFVLQLIIGGGVVFFAISYALRAVTRY